MRKILLSSALVLGLALGACTNGQLDPNQVATVIAQIQADTKAACGVVPVAADVAVLLSGGNPAVTTAAQVASLICSAVTQQQAAHGAAPKAGEPSVVVNGVIIHYHKVS